MKTHTLRKNGAGTGRILTFTPAFVARLEQAHPWAARFLISAVCKEVPATLDYEQHQHFELAIPQPAETSAELYRALHWLGAGHRMLDLDIEQHLVVLDKAARALFAMDAERESGEPDR